MGKAAALLFRARECKTQTAGVDPALTKLAQAPDRLSAVQAPRQALDGCEFTPLDKATATLGYAEVLASGSSFHPRVSVDNYLCPKRRVGAHADRHMPPGGIAQVKVAMLHVSPVLAMAQLDDLTFSAAPPPPRPPARVRCP